MKCNYCDKDVDNVKQHVSQFHEAMESYDEYESEPLGTTRSIKKAEQDPEGHKKEWKDADEYMKEINEEFSLYKETPDKRKDRFKKEEKSRDDMDEYELDHPNQFGETRVKANEGGKKKENKYGHMDDEGKFQFDAKKIWKDASEDFGEYDHEDLYPTDPEGDDFRENGYLTDANYNMSQTDMNRLYVDTMKTSLNRAIQEKGDSMDWNYWDDLLQWWTPHTAMFDLPNSKGDTPEAQQAFTQAKQEVTNWFRDQKQSQHATYPTPSWESVAGEGWDNEQQFADYWDEQIESGAGEDWQQEVVQEVGNYTNNYGFMKWAELPQDLKDKLKARSFVYESKANEDTTFVKTDEFDEPVDQDAEFDDMSGTWELTPEESEKMNIDSASKGKSPLGEVIAREDHTLKQKIKKLEKFINLASMENPMNLGSQIEELENLKNQLASVTGAEADIWDDIEKEGELDGKSKKDWMDNRLEQVTSKEIVGALAVAGGAIRAGTQAGARVAGTQMAKAGTKLAGDDASEGDTDTPQFMTYDEDEERKQVEKEADEADRYPQKDHGNLDEWEKELDDLKKEIGAEGDEDEDDEIWGSDNTRDNTGRDDEERGDDDPDNEKDLGVEMWNIKPYYQKIESFENLGFKQGDATKMANLTWHEYTSEVRKALETEEENDKKRNDSQDAFDDEGDAPQMTVDDDSIDYNIIGESQTSRTKYECEHCNSGFKSTEALLIHYNDIHAKLFESIGCFICGESNNHMVEHLAYEHGFIAKEEVKKKSNEVNQHCEKCSKIGVPCQCDEDIKGNELWGQNDPDEIMGGSWGTPENTADDLYNMTSHNYDQGEYSKWEDKLIDKVGYKDNGKFDSMSVDKWLRSKGVTSEDMIYDLVMQFGGGSKALESKADEDFFDDGVEAMKYKLVYLNGMDYGYQTNSKKEAQDTVDEWNTSFSGEPIKYITQESSANEDEWDDLQNKQKKKLKKQFGDFANETSSVANCPLCDTTLISRSGGTIDTFTRPFDHAITLARHFRDIHGMSEDEAENSANKESDKYDGFAPNWVNTSEDIDLYPSLGESKANEDDPDFKKDPDYQGYVGDDQVEPSQYTQSGMDHDDPDRGDTDFDALEKAGESMVSWDVDGSTSQTNADMQFGQLIPIFNGTMKASFKNTETGEFSFMANFSNKNDAEEWADNIRDMEDLGVKNISVESVANEHAWQCDECGEQLPDGKAADQHQKETGHYDMGFAVQLSGDSKWDRLSEGGVGSGPQGGGKEDKNDGSFWTEEETVDNFIKDSGRDDLEQRVKDGTDDYQDKMKAELDRRDKEKQYNFRSGEGGVGSGPQKDSALEPEQIAMKQINPDYDPYSKDAGNKYDSPMTEAKVDEDETCDNCGDMEDLNEDGLCDYCHNESGINQKESERDARD